MKLFTAGVGLDLVLLEQAAGGLGRRDSTKFLQSSPSVDRPSQDSWEFSFEALVEIGGSVLPEAVWETESRVSVQTRTAHVLDWLSVITKRIIEAAELSKTGSCHLFRHSMATAMLDNGADLRHIQEMLGHTDIASTQLYTKVSVAKLKEVHTKTHPAKWKG